MQFIFIFQLIGIQLTWAGTPPIAKNNFQQIPAHPSCNDLMENGTARAGIPLNYPQEAVATWEALSQFWDSEMKKWGIAFFPSQLVMVSQVNINTPCGLISDIFPFYCAKSNSTYIHYAFWAWLAKKSANSKGARTYVFAHEYGHHIQRILNTLQRVESRALQIEPNQRNRLKMLLELNADAMAGFALKSLYLRNILDAEELSKVGRIFQIIGDDRTYGPVARDPLADGYQFGTIDQRKSWFVRGFQSESLANTNTFDDTALLQSLDNKVKAFCRSLSLKGITPP